MEKKSKNLESPILIKGTRLRIVYIPTCGDLLALQSKEKSEVEISIEFVALATGESVSAIKELSIPTYMKVIDFIFNNFKNN